MAHPTRTGDLVVFSDAAVPVRRGDARHADRPLGVLRPARLRARRAGPREQHEHAGDVPRRRRAPSSAAACATCAASTSRRRRRSCSTSRRRSTARASCGATCSTTAHRYTPLSIIGLNDFHGQLDQTTTPIDGLNVNVGGAAQLATMFDEEADALPGSALLLAAGDNVGASPPNSALLEDRPAIDVENAWGLDATSFGNHEFDFGVERILGTSGAGGLPVPLGEHRRGGHRRGARMDRAARRCSASTASRVGVIGATVQDHAGARPAGATAGLEFLDEAERIRRESRAPAAPGREGADRRHPRGRRAGRQRDRRPARRGVGGPDHRIVEELQDTTVDLVDRRPHAPHRQHVVGRIPVVEGVNAGGSYSVAQLMVRGGDVAWAARRRAWPRTSASRRART